MRWPLPKTSWDDKDPDLELPPSAAMPKSQGSAWNLTSCNRLIAERIEGRKHEKHIRALEGAKGMVDHTPPPEHNHLRTKPKTKMLQEDRAAEIQLENRILLQKMLNIDTKLSPLSSEAMQDQRVTPRTMHGDTQRRELDRITNENQAMLRRLQSAQPSISTQQWYDDEIERQALKFRLSQNSCRGRAARLRMPDKPQQSLLPRLGGAGGRSFGEDDWAELSNNELEMHLHQLENQRANVPAIGY
jgi:E3 ubiquitin-protein ligase TRIP12